MNVDDMRDRGLEPGSRVDILTDLPGQERCVEDYLVVGYPTPRGSAAAYFPEVNTLIPLDHHAPNVGTPASKAVPIRVRLRSSV